MSHKCCKRRFSENKFQLFPLKESDGDVVRNCTEIESNDGYGNPETASPPDNEGNQRLSQGLESSGGAY